MYLSEVGIAIPLNETAYAVVTALQTVDGEALVGPVARGGCMVAGEMACKTTCQLWALRNETADEQTVELVEAELLDPYTILEEDPLACPDANLVKAFERLGINPARALMVAVGMNETANRIGYVDDPAVQASMVPNPHGWYELTTDTPYNALFAHEGDTLPNGEPVELIGARIGGNAVVVDDIQTPRGHAYGLTHLTRTNMPGSGHLQEYDGQTQTYRNYVASDSLRRYAANPADVTTHIVSSVGLQTAQVRYPDRNAIDTLLPGWAEDGLLTNLSNLNWRPGMEVVNPTTGEYDLFERDYPEQVRRQVHGAAKKLSVTDVRDDTMLDPGLSSNGLIHSSADRARILEKDDESQEHIGSITDRDLYAIVFRRPS